jgi:hypothetical protein
MRHRQADRWDRVIDNLPYVFVAVLVVTVAMFWVEVNKLIG